MVRGGEVAQLGHGESPTVQAGSPRVHRMVAALLAGDDVLESPLDSPAPEPEVPAAEAPDPKVIQEASPAPRGTASPASLERWRSVVATEGCSSVQREIRRHLHRAPTDGAAWSLLGDCARKSSKWRAAFDAYKRAAETQTPRAGARACYFAGEIALERLSDPRAAEQLLNRAATSLAGDDPLQTVAQVKRARALLMLEQRDDARALLQEVVKQHPGSSVSVEMQQLLDELGLRVR
jgi:tetratricopeptide (TPR) repeat protein